MLIKPTKHAPKFIKSVTIVQRNKIARYFDKRIEPRAPRKVHRANIRASSMPLCQRDHLFTEVAKQVGEAPMVPEDVEKMMFVNIGTILHEVIQAHIDLGLEPESSPLLWGSWQCNTCQKYWINQGCPGIHCGNPTEYIEYTFEHPKLGNYGHGDGLLLYPRPGGGYDGVLLEIKTTGESLADARVKNGAVPKHRVQGSIYVESFKRGLAYAIIKQGGKIITKVPAAYPPDFRMLPLILFVYVRRDKPRVRFWIKILEESQHPGALDDMYRIRRRSNKSIISGNLPPGKCQCQGDATDEWGHTCPWATRICYTPGSRKPRMLWRILWRKFHAGITRKQPTKMSGRGFKRASGRSSGR